MELTLTERMLRIERDLDSLKEEGVYRFPDGPSFDDVYNATSGRRGQLMVRENRELVKQDPGALAAAAHAEGVLMGYRLRLEEEQA
jgi:hypothetical protein